MVNTDCQTVRARIAKETYHECASKLGKVTYSIFEWNHPTDWNPRLNKEEEAR